jgi:two-component system response regulator HydG
MLRDLTGVHREEQKVLERVEEGNQGLATGLSVPVFRRCGDLCQLASPALASPALAEVPPDEGSSPGAPPVDPAPHTQHREDRAPPRRNPAGKAPPARWNPLSAGGRVLLVEESAEHMDLMTRLLESEGHKVRGASSPGAALAVIADLAIGLDVVVADVNLSEMSGIEFCERLLGVRPDLFVIVNTDHADLNTAVAALRVGAYDFLPKPIDPQVFLLRIAHAIRQHELTEEIARLRHPVPEGHPLDMVGSGAAMRHVHDLVARVASSDTSVLIQGETGTGKELVARAIHAASHAKAGPFVAVNCAAVPSALIESEFFGHARGAFTDAKMPRVGLLRQAEGGTIFLDEIGELPIEMQSKLLRAMQERRVRPVGSDQEVPFNARVLSATNRDLEDEVQEKRFREDLYYRIAVVKIELPRLRDRGGDVIEIASHCLQEIERRTGKPSPRISPAVAEKLLSYRWPGNVRELENSMERAAAFAHFDDLTVDDLPEKIRAYEADRFAGSAEESFEIVKVEEVERRYITRALALLGGNKTRAAEVLGIDRRTLYRKLERWSAPGPHARARVQDNPCGAAPPEARSRPL